MSTEELQIEHVVYGTGPKTDQREVVCLFANDYFIREVNYTYRKHWRRLELIYTGKEFQRHVEKKNWCLV